MIDSANPENPAEPAASAAVDGGRKRPPPLRAEAMPSARDERVDVRLDLLDQLLKHTAEAGIYRARMLQQNKDLADVLEHLAHTLGGMQKRLVELESGSEAHELLGGLRQDASDLTDSEQALQDLFRNSRTLLQQQAVAIDDLQDGLLKARGLSSSPYMADVLLGEVADNLLAIPHANGYEIIRATGQELAACYQGEAPAIAHAGAEYPVRYLGSMLGLEAPVLSGTSKWYPLVLAGPAGQREAIQLDQLLGSIQVMVQPLGAQLGSLRWFTGGAILADGRIALLLDLNVLLESLPGQRHAGAAGASADD